MKGKLYILLFTWLVLTGCEVIPEDEQLIPVETDISGNRTHVLLEFTGFRCVNCPTAAATAQTLHDLYGDRLIVVALHPASNPFTQGVYDYTCPAADSIYQSMGGTATTPFPTGNIDMMPQEGRWFFDPIEWAEQVSHAMEDSACAPLSMLTEYRMSYWLVEDSVPGVQAMPDGTVNMNYYHRHVLRTVSEEPITALPDGCNPDYCTVLEIITDFYDNHIINAYETKWNNSGLMSSMDD